MINTYKQDKIMSAAQNRQELLFLVLALTLNWEIIWKPKQWYYSLILQWSTFLQFLQLLVVMKTQDPAHRWHGDYVSAINYHHVWLQLQFLLHISDFTTQTQCKLLVSQRWSNTLVAQICNPMSLVCFLYSRGSDGDLVVRSDKVPLQCINKIVVRPQNVAAA